MYGEKTDKRQQRQWKLHQQALIPIKREPTKCPRPPSNMGMKFVLSQKSELNRQLLLQSKEWFTKFQLLGTCFGYSGGLFPFWFFLGLCCNNSSPAGVYDCCPCSVKPFQVFPTPFKTLVDNSCKFQLFFLDLSSLLLMRSVPFLFFAFSFLLESKRSYNIKNQISENLQSYSQNQEVK